MPHAVPPSCAPADRRGGTAAKPHRGSRSAGRPPAFTIIETAISMVIAGLVLVAALGTTGTVARFGQIQRDDARGQMLAQDLMAEILQCQYREPGGSDTLGRDGVDEGAGDRIDWDDVDDYHGVDNLPPQDRDGQPLAGFDGWRRTAGVLKVDPATLAPLGNQGGADTGMRLVTITATSPGGRLASLSALRGEFTDLEQPPTLDWEYVSYVGVELQPETDPATRVRVGVPILNQRPPAPAEGGGP